MRRDIIKMVLQDTTGMYAFYRSIRFVVTVVRATERGYYETKGQ